MDDNNPNDNPLENEQPVKGSIKLLQTTHSNIALIDHLTRIPGNTTVKTLQTIKK